MSPEQRKRVDGYVSSLIKHYSKEFGIDIDPQNPTREQRLNLALALDKKGDHSSRWSAMEIMVGRRIDSTERRYAFLLMQYQMIPQDARKFYEGFSESEKEIRPRIR